MSSGMRDEGFPGMGPGPCELCMQERTKGSHGVGICVADVAQKPNYKHAEAVDHPKHYGGDTTYEAIKVIEAWGVGFHVGIALKHLCRAGKKTNEPEEKDIEKAIWYLHRYLEVLKEKR